MPKKPAELRGVREERSVRFLRRNHRADPAKLPSRAARLAFWINAYNALTIHSVLPHWPGIKSVSNVYPKFAFFDRVVHVVGGKKYSLNQIENEIIRPRFNEPRIHAALNCASISCPPIQPFAFTAKKLSQLDRAFGDFANDPARNLVDVEKDQVRLSQIFNWYGKDFVQAGGPHKYIAPFVKDEKKKAVLLAAKKVDFLKYDWNNQQTLGDQTIALKRDAGGHQIEKCRKNPAA